MAFRFLVTSQMPLPKCPPDGISLPRQIPNVPRTQTYQNLPENTRPSHKQRSNVLIFEPTQSDVPAGPTARQVPRRSDIVAIMKGKERSSDHRACDGIHLVRRSLLRSYFPLWRRLLLHRYSCLWRRLLLRR